MHLCLARYQISLVFYWFSLFFYCLKILATLPDAIVMQFKYIYRVKQLVW